jgi:dethiobiotin synthetase/adenosylmethionine--8-amino-7-oxononanoate aminotransferase
MKKGTWTTTMTPELQGTISEPLEFSSLPAIFAADRFDSSSTVYKAYEVQITKTLTSLRDAGHKLGALIIEPVVLGAGGMLFA